MGLDMDIREIQSRLAAMGLYSGRVDGLWGPATNAAVAALALKEHVSIQDSWDRARRFVAAVQMICRIDGIEAGAIDGLPGQQTTHAVTVYDARRANGGKPDPLVENWRDKPQPTGAQQSPAAMHWPRQSEVPSFFGPVGSNQVTMTFPYPMRIAWEKTRIVTSTSCHKLIAAPARRALERVLDAYGLEEIQRLRLDLFGGCLNVRKMRGGSSWSMHSWGIAFDFDPEHNQLNWNHTKAEFAKPEYTKWFDLWESEGAVSLLRARDMDAMHVQFARL